MIMILPEDLGLTYIAFKFVNIFTYTIEWVSRV